LSAIESDSAFARETSSRDPVLATERLVLRRLDLDDAPFIFELVNDPDWLRHIGDKNVRSLDDARAYLVNGPIAMYAKHGFGLYAVERREDGALIGMCGLIKRDTLDDVDIGFAYLPAYRAQGYAREAAAATLAHARDALGMKRVVAIVSPANHASARLLERVGLRYESAVRTAADRDPIDLFAIDFIQLPVVPAKAGTQ
jgi:RimJ/RimL family protein N-acetyltransferase